MSYSFVYSVPANTEFQSPEMNAYIGEVAKTQYNSDKPVYPLIINYPAILIKHGSVTGLLFTSDNYEDLANVTIIKYNGWNGKEEDATLEKEIKTYTENGKTVYYAHNGYGAVGTTYFIPTYYIPYDGTKPLGKIAHYIQYDVRGGVSVQVPVNWKSLSANFEITVK